MPGFNEQDAIAASLRSLLALEYPEEKLELVAVNDGSTDATLQEMNQVASEAKGRVNVIDFPENRGKRAAMAAGIRATEAEVIVFVDSDSVVEPGALRKLVQPLARPAGGRGLRARRRAERARDVADADAGRSLFRRVPRGQGGGVGVQHGHLLLGLLLGLPARGDHAAPGVVGEPDLPRRRVDLRRRPLADQLRAARLARAVREERGLAHDRADHFRAFVKQQTRWKRSWTRESLMVSRFIWRKHPIAAAFVYLSIVLPLIAPVAALHSIAWGPVMHGTTLPLIYVAGLYSLAVVYSLYYVLFQDRYSVLWMYGILFVFFYLAIMLWQTYYAIATCRTAAWGTRPATAGITGGGDGGAERARRGRGPAPTVLTGGRPSTGASAVARRISWAACSRCCCCRCRSSRCCCSARRCCARR